MNGIRRLVLVDSLRAVLAAQVTFERTYGGPADVLHLPAGVCFLATGGRESALKFVSAD